jgi:hypothetical protein
LKEEADMNTQRNPADLAPSDKARAEKHRKILVGQGTILVISGIAVVAFAIYAVVMLYAVMTAN